MGTRNKNTVPWKVWIPAELALNIELRYVDPLTGKPSYAARSHLITALLQEFDRAVSKIEKNHPSLVQELIARLIAQGGSVASFPQEGP